MTYTQIFGAFALAIAMLLRRVRSRSNPCRRCAPIRSRFARCTRNWLRPTRPCRRAVARFWRSASRAHLQAAGFTDKDLTLFSVPDHPKEGGLVAVLAGSSSTAKPMLLLGHLDVVEAKREDWTRDPFTLIEENGYFYGRGAADMKAMDATWIDMLMRFKQRRLSPQTHHQTGVDLRRGDHLCL